MEEGLVCLDDYLNILDIRRLDFDNWEHIKGKFLAAIIYFKKNEYKEA